MYVPRRGDAENAKLHEQSATIKLPEGKGDRYRIRVISAGQGSSAFYPAETLKRDGAKAFPAGTRMKANHDGWMDFGGDVDRIRAKTTTAAQWDEAEQALMADIQVAEAWSPWFREFADVIGVSISASGKLVEEEVDGEIRYTCEQLFSAENSPYNSHRLRRGSRREWPHHPGARVGQGRSPSPEHQRDFRARFELLEKKSEATPPRINEEDEVPMDKKELEEMLARDSARQHHRGPQARGAGRVGQALAQDDLRGDRQGGADRARTRRGLRGHRARRGPEQGRRARDRP
jgi:hypothetical protein